MFDAIVCLGIMLAIATVASLFKKERTITIRY